ncbi:hypothetical protein MPTK1_8g04790 [Marchantia polymorpha subsp. ruderalis]|uniref:Uncharacterized protein n=1 Tax=Marchantia polymorpha TaxID=3197 RepID=A0A2R6VZY3_MARPO|nr:hypothetical protein MARPO_0217s0003 [Marchantia polymorpha]BBN18708.1 hypothetical protein Mp_8g04790 [Marchantia polymorpha subsp. ruderalis]|eukprot:PTQ27142.1 hypothetical protein MARPO_0217s0003 [Marchantia polymorpha]
MHVLAFGRHCVYHLAGTMQYQSCGSTQLWNQESAMVQKLPVVVFLQAASPEEQSKQIGSVPVRPLLCTFRSGWRDDDKEHSTRFCVFINLRPANEAKDVAVRQSGQ